MVENGTGNGAASLTAEAPTPRVLWLADLLGEWERHAAEAWEARMNGTRRGPVTSLPTLDGEIGDALQVGVHIVHGEPGAGKTAFALQVAASCGCPALYLSCEMAALELLRRITARVTGTYLGRLKSGEYDPAASLALARRAVEAVPGLALIDATLAFAGAAWLRNTALGFRGPSSHLLLIVDSLHSWAEGAEGDASEYERINAALLSLRSLAATLECPVLVVAERNRASMKGGGLSAGAGSRKIEYGAETVIDLRKNKKDGEEEEPKPDGAGEIEVLLRLAKNRNGAAGREVKLKFHGALQRFREVDR